MFSLESVVGPVHTCLVLVMFPVFRCLFVMYPAASSFGCPGFLPRRTGMFQSTRNILYHFYAAASDLNQVDMDLLPQMIVRL